MIYQSAFCRDSAERFLGPCEAASEIIFNPVDLQKFRPAATPLPAEPLRLLTLGTHGYAQRVLSTIDCARVLTDRGIDCLLTIAGRLGWSGGVAETRRAIAKLGLDEKVTVLASFTQEEAAELYRSAPYFAPSEIPRSVSDRRYRGTRFRTAGGRVRLGRSSGNGSRLLWRADSCSALVGEIDYADRRATRRGGRSAPSPAPSGRDAQLGCMPKRRYDGAKWVERHATIFRRLLA